MRERFREESHWNCRYSSAVTCVGETFCACAAYNFVVLYDRKCTRAIAVLRAHSHKVTAVAAACVSDDEIDDEVVLSGGRDKAVIAWSVRRQRVLRKKQKLPGDVTAIALCPHDGDVAMVALSTGGVSLWKWNKGLFWSLLLLHRCLQGAVSEHKAAPGAAHALPLECGTLRGLWGCFHTYGALVKAAGSSWLTWDQVDQPAFWLVLSLFVVLLRLGQHQMRGPGSSSHRQASASMLFQQRCVALERQGACWLPLRAHADEQTYQGSVLLLQGDMSTMQARSNHLLLC